MDLQPENMSNDKLGNVLHSSLRESTMACCIATVEVKGLDEMTIVEMVTAAVRTALEESVEPRGVVSRDKWRGQNMATIISEES